MTETLPLDDKNLERRERILHTYYERLNNLDKSIQELTSFYFGINTAILALVFQLVQGSLQRLILALMGYCVSITLYVTTYKSFLAWRTYAQDMNELEDELDYDISKKYNVRLEHTPGKSVRITLTRMRFNFLFVVLWIGIMGFLLRELSRSWHFSPPWLDVFLPIILFAVIIYLPWLYLIGSGRPRLLWETLRALGEREV